MPIEEEDNAWLLISLELCGELNEPGEMEFIALIKANPPVKNRFLILEACWTNRRKEIQESFDSFYCKLLTRLENRDPNT